jgi:hypothetical protein
MIETRTQTGERTGGIAVAVAVAADVDVDVVD